MFRDAKHVFAGDPLDRVDKKRRDPEWVRKKLADNKSVFLPFWRTKVAIRTAPALSLGWQSKQFVSNWLGDVDVLLLGIQHDVAHFTLDLSSIDDIKTVLALDSSTKFIDPRSIAPDLPAGESGMLAHAKSQTEWHARNQFCSNCGGGTRPSLGGKERICNDCKSHHFPRTDPVAIMVVHKKGQCLLGRSHSGSGVYSALAGFIDQGESIEEAVRREILEEAGVLIGDVKYHSSQPWPYTSSLMIGCIAEALTCDLTIDNEELADVRWFSRREIASSLNARDNKQEALVLPGPIAIAHHLLAAWISEF